MTENVKLIITLSTLVLSFISLPLLIEYFIGLRENRKTHVSKFALEPDVDVRCIFTTRMIDGYLKVDIEYFISVDGKEKLRPPQSLEESILSNKFEHDVLQQEFAVSMEDINTLEEKVSYEVNCYNEALDELIKEYKSHVENIRRRDRAKANQKKLRINS